MGFHKVSGQLTLFTRDEIVYTWFAGILLWCIIWGFVTKAIVKGKGYENSGAWFWCGFFLGIIGVIVAACKPAINVPLAYHYTKSPHNYNPVSTKNASSSGFWVCKCRTINPKTQNICKNCGNISPYATKETKQDVKKGNNAESIKKQLNELKELQEQGLITEDDYNAKKKQILNI